MYGRDEFNYEELIATSAEEKLASWQKCRDAMGMHATPDPDDKSRQQFTGVPFFQK